jgi:hypothetical protein
MARTARRARGAISDRPAATPTAATTSVAEPNYLSPGAYVTPRPVVRAVVEHQRLGACDA